jgi:hypothetical protein
MVRGLRFLAIFLLFAGCGGGETPSAADLAGSPPDLARATVDGPPAADLSAATDGEVPDAAGALDLAMEVDLAVEADLAEPADLSEAPSDGPAGCANTPQSCGPAGACVDCTNNTFGHVCVSSTCGCNSANDCPAGSACDPNTKQCSASCAGNLTCNGGCCDGQKCIAGNDNDKCGGNGGACAVCGGGKPTCESGNCTAKCVVGAMSGVCGMGFCCNAQNQCQAIANEACGAAGASCVDCAKSPRGPVCSAGVCGCAKAADCPAGQACKTGVCGTACDANTPCNGGCCSNGACVAGNAPTACALGAAQCGSCAGNPAGGACVTVGGKVSCGCASENDCPANMACDLATKQCTTLCSAQQQCNAGCCSAAQNGMCIKGTGNAACGATGGVCQDCNGNTNGHLCVAIAGGGQCGCADRSDCPLSSVSCDNVKKICVNVCDTNNKCQFGCCSAAVNGSCQTGLGDSACGASGLCVDCAMSNSGHVCRAPGVCGCEKTADCPKGTACNLGTHLCENKCNPNQPCNGGCCAGGACVAGDQGGACGSAGAACVDCTATQAKACLAGACGCNVAADCPAGQACDAMTHKCTNVCNANQRCNGGCCAAGLCVAGTANSACGTAGGLCTACANGTPTCVAGACNARCGGNADGACDGGFCCKGGACVAGNTQTACGFKGACGDCSTSQIGTRCVTPMNGPYFCGCTAAGDCPAARPAMGIAGQACDLINRFCTTLCGNNSVSACNGGCCSGPNGQCRAGNGATTCGINGMTCTNCQTSCNAGLACNAQTGTCGCNSNQDCNANSCLLRRTCTQQRCCQPAGSLCANNASCCSNRCQNNRCQ